MSYKMNLWSLTLLPGQKHPLYVRRDFTLTNAALGEELRSNDGRSVVKVTHNPVPPAFGDSDSDYDSAFESELDSEVDEDEFELDDVEGFKLTPKKAKKDEDEDDDDDEKEDDEVEDEEDEEDDDDEDDFSDEEAETNVICALTAGKIEQASLDLTFVEGDAVIFEVSGENAVHLLGNYIYQPGLTDSEDDSDFDDEHDDYSDLYGSDFDEELDSDEEAPDATIEEIDTEPPVKTQAKIETVDKKRKADAIESPASKAEAGETLSKAQKKKLAKKAKRDSDAVTADPAPAVEKKTEKKVTEKKSTEKKRTLPSGLIIEDVKVGDGPVAKTGKRLGMRYIGKLENGKQFDANTGGKPFVFQLGRGEVIRGWDEGLAGMAVGGERRLTIPAALAYGNQKIPGIPKGSTLKFDVKLVSVN